MDKDVHSKGDGAEKNKGITRRQFLGRTWWAASGLLVVEATGGFVASLWPKFKAGSFGSKFSIASVEEARAMPVGTVTYFLGQRFYLSRVESGFLALYRKCPHLGCVVPWFDDQTSEDDLAEKGRFNCPCHGGVYDRYGVVHAGPPPRPLDLLPITIEKGEVIVDTGNIIQRSGFDESQVVKI